MKNYLIASINEVDYFGKEYSMGVLTLFNKEGKISKEDIQRILSMQKFLGAAATRVSLITSSLTVLIGLSMVVEPSMARLTSLEEIITQSLTEATGPNGHIAPMETMHKNIGTYWELMSNFLETIQQNK